MAAEGSLQRDIAQALSVSVMTFHRWRKASIAQSQHEAASLQDQQIRELELENSRLRKLVTDLLLEKIMLEEEQHTRPTRAVENGHATPHSTLR
jgi:hypothetical protein